MILVTIRPEELQNAVKRNIPVIMAAGVVEYHGPQTKQSARKPPEFRRVEACDLVSESPFKTET